jgi:hypothetical protein
MTHHRYIKVTMDVWLVDPLKPPTTSGPPDAAVVSDLTTKAGRVSPVGQGNPHKVHQIDVISTDSQTTPPPAPKKSSTP